jgi:hypothetical protein
MTLLKPLHGCAMQASRVLSMAFRCQSTVVGLPMVRGSRCAFVIVMRNNWAESIKEMQ